MGLFERKKEQQQEAQVIDLTERRRPRQRWGQPGRCPACNGIGYLDHIDLVGRFMIQHCTECNHRWETAEAEVSPTA